MENRRIELRNKLALVTEIKNLYFQPPDGKKMDYPCIVYSKDPMLVEKANDKPYLMKERYSVMVIHRDPDAFYPEVIVNSFDYASYERRNVYDNLYHDVFTIYI